MTGHHRWPTLGSRSATLLMVAGALMVAAGTRFQAARNSVSRPFEILRSTVEIGAKYCWVNCCSCRPELKSTVSRPARTHPEGVWLCASSSGLFLFRAAILLYKARPCIFSRPNLCSAKQRMRGLALQIGACSVKAEQKMGCYRTKTTVFCSAQQSKKTRTML